MKNLKIIIAGAAAVVVVAGAAVYNKFDTWLPSEPTGPGSGDELTEADIAQMESDRLGPGSGDELPADEPTGPGSGDELPANEPTGPGSGDELTEADIAEMNREWPGPGSGDEITYEGASKGSCDKINDASICAEYYGSYWSAANIQLACAGVGAYSTKPCPRPALGGCLMSAGTANEMAAWYYDYGGSPQAESLSYAAQACNANPFGQWIGAN